MKNSNFVLMVIILLAGIFLLNMNISNKEEKKIDSIAANKPAQDSSFKNIPSVFQKDTVVIKKGGSLYRDLGMTEDQALKFVERYRIKHYYCNGRLIAIIQPGDTYVRDWRPLNFNL